MPPESLTLAQALQLAVKFLNENNLQQAESLCRQILQAAPNQPDALHLLGIVAYKAGYLNDAIGLIQQAIAVNPQLLDAYYNLASIYRESKQYQAAIECYEKGFAQTFQWQPIYLNAMIEYACNTPVKNWQGYRANFIQYGYCLYQVGELQKYDLSELMKQNLLLHKLSESEARFLAFTLLELLQFNKLTIREWNVHVFEQVALPSLKQALNADYYELGLSLEGYIYDAYVKQKETEENFRTSFNQWLGEMCAAGKRVRATLPVLDKNIFQNTPPTIAFFIHNATLLAHIEVMLNMLEGLTQLDEKPFKPIIYAFGGYHEGLVARCQKIGVPIVFFAQLCADKGSYAKLLFLRERVIADKVTALVWISLAVMMPFAFSMRVAPVQIWWAMKYHGLEFEDVDGYVTGSSSGKYKRFGEKIWRTGSLGRTDWYLPELDVQARAIRQQYYNQFDLILGTMGREEILNSLPFVETVARILKKYPKAAFLWTGRHQLQSIQDVFNSFQVEKQCFFIGWVNTRVYAQVFDVFLDAFPFPCGFTAFETAAASKPIVLYASSESYETGLVSNISPVLHGHVGTDHETNLLKSIFYPEGIKLYFCASNPDEYFDYACQFIENKHLRQQVGCAYGRFIECFFADIEKMASTYTEHFLDVINEVDV
jgi:tetratricopeptide (TPR) repeat protein